MSDTPHAETSGLRPKSPDVDRRRRAQQRRRRPSPADRGSQLGLAGWRLSAVHPSFRSEWITADRTLRHEVRGVPLSPADTFDPLSLVGDRVAAPSAPRALPARRSRHGCRRSGEGSLPDQHRRRSRSTPCREIRRRARRVRRPHPCTSFGLRPPHPDIARRRKDPFGMRVRRCVGGKDRMSLRPSATLH